MADSFEEMDVIVTVLLVIYCLLKDRDNVSTIKQSQERKTI